MIHDNIEIEVSITVRYCTTYPFKMLAGCKLVNTGSLDTDGMVAEAGDMAARAMESITEKLNYIGAAEIIDLDGLIE